MRSAGYIDVERGERGSFEEHLTVTQFKVEKEQERLANITEQTAQKAQEAASLEKKIEKIQKKAVGSSDCGQDRTQACATVLQGHVGTLGV